MLGAKYQYVSNSWLIWGLVFVGFLILFIPSYYNLAITLWATDEQGHGPLVLAISMFLMWQKKDFLFSSEYVPTKGQELFGFFLLFVSSLTFLAGNLLGILVFEIGSQILFIVAIVLVSKGLYVLKKFWFPLFFMIFMLPLPGDVVDALTLPMKIAVSTFAEYILYGLDYPIARSGVILQIGQYKLLVADACAGLHTVFTLEAMGLLYLHLIHRDSFFRNVTLAVLIVPISFMANTVRVVALVLITFYFGDEVGQGFVHDFAGFVLFGVALVLIIMVDSFIHFFEKIYAKRKGNVSA